MLYDTESQHFMIKRCLEGILEQSKMVRKLLGINFDDVSLRWYNHAISHSLKEELPT